ncbi:MAG: PorT family protein [Chitinispirillaceae bacterium]|nr:PorT family protein [Chitinispirillaceae bacterium]
MRSYRSLFLVSLFAASSFALKLGIGADAGLQWAWIDRWVVETPLVGVNLPLFINDRHGVQLSLRYGPKGYENDSGDVYESEWLHYLDIPLSYLFYPDFFPVKLGVSLGATYSALLGVSLKSVGGFETSPYKDDYKGYDYGLNVGVHFKQPLQKGALLFSLLYYHGFMTVREWWLEDEGAQQIRVQRKVKNHALSLCIGYDLQLKEF